MATCQVLYFRLPPSTGNVIPAIPAIQKTPNVNIKSDNESDPKNPSESKKVFSIKHLKSKILRIIEV